MPQFNVGAAMQRLFGGNTGNTGAPPPNPNAQPTNQREQQQQQAKGKTPSGEFTQLESGSSAESNEASGTGEPANPLDKFKDIWQPLTGADGKPLPETKRPSFAIDATKMMEFASKQDFKKFVKPETMTAIAKGGEEGTAAMLQAFQDIGSSSFATSMTASSQLVERALAAQRQDFETSLPELVKRFSLKDNLRTKNPILSHPAASPIIEALQVTLAKNNPNATAAELQETAEEYLTSLAASFSGKKATEDDSGGNKSGKKEQDWGKFLPDFNQ